VARLINTLEIKGIQETLKELNLIDRRARLQFSKDIKKAGAIVVENARELIPTEPPISGMRRGNLVGGRDGTKWNSEAAKKGFIIIVGRAGAKAKRVDFNRTVPQLGVSHTQRVDFKARPYELMVLRQRDAAAAIWDHAGIKAGNTAFVANLNAEGEVKHGPPPRASEPAVEKSREGVEAEVKIIVKKVMDKMNKKFKARSGN